jgi:hypothetical protein
MIFNIIKIIQKITKYKIILFFIIYLSKKYKASTVLFILFSDILYAMYDKISNIYRIYLISIFKIIIVKHKVLLN